MKHTKAVVTAAICLAAAAVHAQGFGNNSSRYDRQEAYQPPPPPARYEPMPRPRPGYEWNAGRQEWNGRAYVWTPGFWVAVRSRPDPRYDRGYDQRYEQRGYDRRDYEPPRPIARDPFGRAIDQRRSDRSGDIPDINAE